MMMMMMFDIEPTRQVIMSSEETKPVAHQQKPRKRKFYIMSFSGSVEGRSNALIQVG
jgi:hypothetical protein